MEERKMEKNMRKIFLGILIIGLTVFLSGIAIAGAEVSISGVINEDGQLVDDDGMAYDIAESEEGDQIMEMVGSKVTVKGTVMSMMTVWPTILPKVKKAIRSWRWSAVKLP
jgi:hypothetical protein